MEEKKELIKKTVEDLLEKMGFASSVEIDSPSETTQEGLTCNIITENDSSFLIGQYGTNLQAIQHLARLLVRKKTDEKIKFILDVNSYRKQKDNSIIELAKETARQALDEKRSVVMKPMSNYERRIVHMELSKNDKIATESIGEGENRKVVVKPADSL